MSENQTLTAARTPTVYFIDDSATMREVIKIAFRKENIHVITCSDAASALAQFGESAPDVVITDVIMPDQDGYEVCQFVKHHEQFGKTPVILMSGVVNRTVAEKAMTVKADELIRKPFQPQDLILRVKNLLHPKPAGVAVDAESVASRTSSQALSSLFSPAHTRGVDPGTAPRLEPPIAAIPPRSAPPTAQRFVQAHGPRAPLPAEVQKLRNEVRQLELLVKKLQAELEAGRQYCEALEAHIKTLQEPE